MSQLYKFAYHLVKKTDCYRCGKQFEYKGIEFHPSKTSYNLEATYECQSCSNCYLLLVEDAGRWAELDVYRASQDVSNEDPVSSVYSKHSSLQEDLHRASDLVEGISELGKILGILEVNRNRITSAVERLREPQGFQQPREFHQEVDADIHNYFSSAYSFSEILSTVKPNLPTDGPVEAKLNDFETEKKVITGLRIYEQHHLTLPTRFRRYFNPNTGDMRTSVAVDISNVNVIESNVSQDSPDGYEEGAEHYYEDVDCDFIDIELQVQSHFNSAENLVITIYSYMRDVRGEDLEDYAEKTDYYWFPDSS